MQSRLFPGEYSHKTGPYNLDGTPHDRAGVIPHLYFIRPEDENKYQLAGWHFCDETEQLNGPYETMEEAAKAFKEYEP